MNEIKKMLGDLAVGSDEDSDRLTIKMILNIELLLWSKSSIQFGWSIQRQYLHISSLKKLGKAIQYLNRSEEKCKKISESDSLLLNNFLQVTCFERNSIASKKLTAR